MEPLLDITTLIERPKIRIDGQLYEMYTRKEISVLDAEKLRLLYTKIDVAEKIKKPNKAQRAAYEQLLRQFVGAICVALPRAVLARLMRPDLVAIIKAYFQPPQVTPARTGSKTGAAKRPSSTGAK